ncbi:condensation domain-containing protein [Streptomyces violascens]|uniref:condensation domain-containing protein n=1 Tax=Streptomyces violascens TaxID=67381 RepID=UPI00365820FB
MSGRSAEPDTGVLSYGQLSVWRDIESLPRERRHEANTWAHWEVPPGTTAEQVRKALRTLGVRHPSLRTVYEVHGGVPRQAVRSFGGGVELDCVEGSPGDTGPMTDELLGRAFELGEDFGWRARIVTESGRPTTVLLAKHHIVADGWCDAVLQRDFRTVLRDPAAPPPTAGPLDLAQWQHSEHRARARESAALHWEKVYASGASGFPLHSADGFLQCTLRSRRARAGAQALAERTGAALASVVLAAYTLAVARIGGVEQLVTQVMFSNRSHPQWRSVVTSMNQWVAAPLTVGDSFEEHIARVGGATLRAYRHGMYDVDAAAALQRHADRPYEATCAFNYLRLDGLSTQGGRGLAEPEDEPQWERPFSTIGHGCYLRAADEGGDTLALRLRTHGIPRDRVAALVTETCSLLASGLARSAPSI